MYSRAQGALPIFRFGFIKGYLSNLEYQNKQKLRIVLQLVSDVRNASKVFRHPIFIFSLKANFEGEFDMVNGFIHDVFRNNQIGRFSLK